MVFICRHTFCCENVIIYIKETKMEKPLVSKNHPLKNILRYINYSQLMKFLIINRFFLIYLINILTEQIFCKYFKRKYWSYVDWKSHSMKKRNV